MAHLHVRIPEYQKQYLEENHYMKSEVVREQLDAFMLEDGADPEEWENKFGE